MADRLRFRPKYDKIIEILLYLAHKRPGTDHYAASKYVYLADHIHLNRYSRPVTFDQYGAMPWGPVALKTYQLLKREGPTMREAGIDSLPFELFHVDNQIMLGEPNRSVDYDLFSETDLEVFDEVLENYGHLTMPELHGLTMKHFAYRKAWEGRAEGSKFATIDYEDILEESSLKQAKIDDIGPISDRL